MKKILCLSTILFMFIASPANNKQDIKEDNSKTHASSVKFKKFRFGSYGEILGQYLFFTPNYASYSKTTKDLNQNGSLQKESAILSLPRLNLAFDYKFSTSWAMGAEFSIKAGGTGQALEYEYGEGIETEAEMEKGGSVEIEQLYFTKTFSKTAQLRAGSMVIPVGMTNAYREPLNYFTSHRPMGESKLIPTTWSEIGLAFMGENRNFQYQAMIVNGLNPLGFTGDAWISQSSKDFVDVSQFNSPAYVLRLGYSGVKGLKLGLSLYHNPNSFKNLEKRHEYKASFRGAISIGSIDALYQNKGIIARGSILLGKINNIDAVNTLTAPNLLKYNQHNALGNNMTYNIEVGYDIVQHFNKKYKLYPFVNHNFYKYNNTFINLNNRDLSEDRKYNVNTFTYGINYKPSKEIAIKLDYTNTKIKDNLNNKLNPENQLGLSIAYSGWFFSK